MAEPRYVRIQPFSQTVADIRRTLLLDLLTSKLTPSLEMSVADKQYAS